MAETRNLPWLRFYDEGVPHTVSYPQTTMPQLLDKAAATVPEHTAIIFAGQEITYRVLAGMVHRLAGALARLGVKKGDRVALMSPNCPQYVVAYMAIQKAGGVVVQVNPMYVERELEYILTDSGAEVIVAYDALYPRIRNIYGATPLKHVILFALGQPAVEAPPGVLWMEKLLAEAPAAAPAVEIDPTADLAVLQYTGGTTGFPKGAMLTHRNIVANAVQTAVWFAGCEYGREKVLAVLPFFHVYGMTVAMNLAVLMGYTQIILPRFEVTQVLECIHAYKPTLFPGAPTMYVAINNHPEVGKYDVRSIRYCISGSAPLPVEVANRFEELTGGYLVEGYGLTEASPVTHCNPLRGRRKVGSIGLPFPDTLCKIVDLETGERELPPGETGELCVKGPQVMKGYWNMPAETSKVLRDGWLYTGDIARMDEEGYFYIVDRKKDMIIAGGFNIYPREVEEVLFEHPKVLEAAVVGIPDPYRGETVKAYVVLKEGQTATAEELMAFCRSKLAAYKVPRQIEFRESLPKTIVGKALRRLLREEELARQKQS
ncbi:long-chain-fatty-acid--CoA ligase [Desulfovirgula thermocuniculi]|uniref:long-chain-fatty-acid--CoA ligase n=1 Tax=Desulfovirgula thermocuniculi TaxID=348842 RepID=UPI000423169D|nr:long-chain fatty acid--CoA ligase [Desulfovirgula thermocuniculi]